MHVTTLLVLWLFMLSTCTLSQHSDVVARSGDDHDGHDDHAEGGAWEWAGVYDLHDDEAYTWAAYKVNGKYADATMKFLIWPTSSATTAGIAAVEEAAETTWEGNATEVEAHSNTSMEASTLYELHFNDAAFASLYQIKLADTHSRSTDSFVIFTGHNPSEFQATGTNPLVAQDGVAAQPLATKVGGTSTTTSTTHNIGEAIGGSVVVAVCSLLGVALLVPGSQALGQRFTIFPLINAFASGAILAVVVFLIVPESLHSIKSQYSDEAQQAAWFGSFIIGGFFTAVAIEWFIGLLFPGHQMHGHGFVDSPSNELIYPSTYFGTPNVTPAAMKGIYEVADPYQLYPMVPNPQPVGFVRRFFGCCPLKPVVLSILIGDGLHNFVDGILIGVAFKACGSSMGWSVVGASVAHEVAAEISEFWMLVNPEMGGLWWPQALVLNLLCSCTGIIAAIIVSYADISGFAIGLMLAYGAGVLLFLATVQIWPTLLHHDKMSFWFVVRLTLAFAIGATAIGLVLLNHKHCEVGGHAGHAH